MSEDSLLTFSVHGLLLLVQYLDARILEGTFSIWTRPKLYNDVFSRAIVHKLAYTVWYARQLKFLELRQNRKLEDGAAKSGRNVLNHPFTKSGFWSSAWLKLAILTSPTAARRLDKAGKLLFPAWDSRTLFGWVTSIQGGKAILWHLWHLTYLSSKFFKSLVDFSHGFLHEKLPDLYRVCTFAFQRAKLQSHQVARCKVCTLWKSSPETRTQSFKSWCIFRREQQCDKTVSSSPLTSKMIYLPRYRHARWQSDCTWLQRCYQ